MLRAVSASRRAGAPQKRALISTCFWLVILVCAARLALLQCGAPAVWSAGASGPVKPTASVSAPRSAGPAQARPGASAERAAESYASSLALHLALGVPSDADSSDDHLLDERAFV